MKSRQVGVAKVFLALFVVCAGTPAIAQALWKYTDKDGKVTYADRPPREGETAVRVNIDTSKPAPPPPSKASPKANATAGGVDARLNARVAAREQYRQKMDAAREELDRAKQALEAGREVREGDTTVVVGRGEGGKPTGANVVNRTIAYEQRIAALEAAVANAESRVAAAEKDFREKAAD